jgi:two-component system chemotaxis response regulator CheY
MKSILVVDDDPLVGKAVQRMLDVDGWIVRLARDGRDALEKVAEQAPDLIVTDIVMPNMEGLEVILALRKSNPHLPIIAVSGGGILKDLDYLDFAGKLGARATLTKPFRRDDLLRAVREVFDDTPE